MQIPTLIDNIEGNTLQKVLESLLVKSLNLDIATGTFEIGAFLSLGKTWQHLDGIRLLMGDETTKRTKDHLIRALQEATDANIESVKQQDDTLHGLAAVRAAIRKGQIVVRVYDKAKFHAKLNLMRAQDPSPVDFATVGSSNFTRPGLTQNVELNSFITDATHIEGLSEWYEARWEEASEVKAELLRTIDRHLKEYLPFTVYAKALHAYFRGREKPADEWEENESVIYRTLSQYQKDGYHAALQIADTWNGALICDGVGSGKTYIGLMLLERYLRENKRVLLITPKSIAESVWNSQVNRQLRSKYGRLLREHYDIKLHTDLGRRGGISDDDLEYFRAYKDVIIIDEAHHFRNPGSNRGRLLMELARDKKLYLLTATPINNSLDDISHLINYFAQGNRRHFASIGMHDFRKYFRDMEKQLEDETTEIAELVEEDDFLRQDPLLKQVLIQRSRKYIKDAEQKSGTDILFPGRVIEPTIDYSLRRVYRTLYNELQAAFDRHDPFLNLAIYNTVKYHNNPERQIENRQKQIVGLIRTLVLKRLESSWRAFEATIENLLLKMAEWLERYAPERFRMWEGTNTRWWGVVQKHIRERLQEDGILTQNTLETLLNSVASNPSEEEDDLASVETYDDFIPEEHDVDRLFDDVVDDMNFLTGLLSRIYRLFYADELANEPDTQQDDKLQQLLNLLKKHPNEKLLIFTEFCDTARYLYSQIQHAGFKDIEQIDSRRKVNREEIIERFSPCYNGKSPESVVPVQTLITTDVLAEGLNLQDASVIVNYDLHWNPVRLMQRVGRLDRRLDPEIEEQLNRTNPTVHVWNFLPPEELNDILKLRKRVDGKILRISRTLGIEGKFVSPDDDDETLRLFNERYEGRESIEELMNLERQRISESNPELWWQLPDLPMRLFSGKGIDDEPPPFLNRDGEPIPLDRFGSVGLFCCYEMPNGEIKWYFYDNDMDEVVDDIEEIWPEVRCGEEAIRWTENGPGGLVDARKKIERHINKYLMRIQAPMGAKPKLVAWMEIS
ncbi:MAG: helicase-related protein [Candidatus Poribacteria bacterium]|nr:helicase-related protein [Candidatus Poribacteria bacterium]